MKTKLTRAVRGILGGDKVDRKDAARVFGVIAEDLNSRGREISEQQKKARDAIESGTRITKRRIPL
ncbi:hypothetical protein [Duganella guangzhouensis]|uniref:hypothetical protein n=1 Tax=Duganella guangzhouensis TaxID=2666084 RepID=UPI0018A2151C|nr:hypothetical protein [Duganella guangzhouensis]